MEPPEVWWDAETEFLFVIFPPDDVVRCISRNGTSMIFGGLEAVYQPLPVKGPVRLDIPVSIGSKQ